MASLVRPSAHYQESYLSALEEFHAEGRQLEQDAASMSDPLKFERFVQSCLAEALPETPRPAGWVPATILWWVNDDEYLGHLDIRHELTGPLRKIGGHIGYEVRPSARRQGHATAMLRAALPLAAELGIDPALVTCDEENVGSREVIERAGGQLAEQEEGKLRFWVPTRLH